MMGKINPACSAKSTAHFVNREDTRRKGQKKVSGKKISPSLSPRYNTGFHYLGFL